MQLSKEEYTRKRIYTGCSVRIENYVTQDNCSASLGKPRDAKQLRIFNSHQTTIKDSYILILLFNWLYLFAYSRIKVSASSKKLDPDSTAVNNGLSMTPDSGNVQSCKPFSV